LTCIVTTRARQAEFLGHVVRKSQLENLLIAGKFKGKKGPGRPITSYLVSLRKWLDPTSNQNTFIQANAKKGRWCSTSSPMPRLGICFLVCLSPLPKFHFSQNCGWLHAWMTDADDDDNKDVDDELSFCCCYC